MDDDEILDVIRYRNPEDVSRVLLNMTPADLDRFYDKRYTLLGEAAKCGNIPAIKMLIERGAKLDHRNEVLAEDPPVKIALVFGRIEAFFLLVQAGADCFAQGWMRVSAYDMLKDWKEFWDLHHPTKTMAEIEADLKKLGIPIE